MRTAINSERVQARFWAKVALPNANGCMLWTAYVNYHGYGMFHLEGRPRMAHRISYELAYGLHGPGLELDHLCGVRHCVAPLHLEAVTHTENVRRGRGGEWNARKTHCPAGHPYDEANTYHPPRGGRRCRTCIAERGKRSRSHADPV